MSRKSLLTSVSVFLCIGALALFATSSFVEQRDLCGALFLRDAAGSSELLLADGAEGTVLNDTATTVKVNSNGSLVTTANQVLFVVNYRSVNVSIKVRFSNATFTTPPKTPQTIPQMNVLYLKVETNVSAAIDKVQVTLHYNRSEIYFTERALWVYSYDASTTTWTRLPTTMDYVTDTLNFTMPALGTLGTIELCLAGQETRDMEFPPWAWFFILVSFSIITFMAVGELVYQGYIQVSMKGTDGRVMVGWKRFLGGWGRIFTQINDRMTGYIDYYQDMAAPVPPLPPEKRPQAVSSLGHLNRLGLQEEAEALEEVYKPIETLPRPVVIAKIEDKNPLAKAVFEESSPEEPEEEPGERTFTPYIPAAVRPKQVEKPQPKPAIKSPKEEKPVKPNPIIAKIPTPLVKSAPPKTKAKEFGIPPDLMQEATKAIKDSSAPEGIKKPTKKAAKKKVAKKTTKKAAKKPAAK